ncbi:MAG: M48 family metallopeptidase [Bacteroidetes bacterium]|nr:M48 family metallopeptidase [Bacteroidota bacterium]
MNVEININKIVKSKNRKTIKMEVANDGFVTLKAPLYFTNEDIKEFLEENYFWLKKTLYKIHSQPIFTRKYEENEEFMFLGKNYLLHIIDKDYPKFKFDGEQFIISKNSILSAKIYFENFYKTKAKKIIKARVIDIASKLNIKFNNIRVTSAGSRWGSCNSYGNVNFSWRLIMATPDAIDYVIIHEFCHLYEFNHSPKFWELVEKIMPDYKVHKKWLTDNSKYMIL